MFFPWNFIDREETTRRRKIISLTKGLVTFKTVMLSIVVGGGPGGEAGARKPVPGDML